MHMSRQLLTVELDDIASKYAVDPIATIEAEEGVVENEGYYLQFPAELRKQASEMARYYQIFYCLENSIRDMVESQLAEAFGEAWWDEHAPENIRTTVAQNKKREQDNGVTLRSPHPLTTRHSESSARLSNRTGIFLVPLSTTSEGWRK